MKLASEKLHCQLKEEYGTALLNKIGVKIYQIKSSIDWCIKCTRGASDVDSVLLWFWSANSAMRNGVSFSKLISPATSVSIYRHRFIYGKYSQIQYGHEFSPNVIITNNRKEGKTDESDTNWIIRYFINPMLNFCFNLKHWCQNMSRVIILFLTTKSINEQCINYLFAYHKNSNICFREHRSDAYGTVSIANTSTCKLLGQSFHGPNQVHSFAKAKKKWKHSFIYKSILNQNINIKTNNCFCEDWNRR